MSDKIIDTIKKSNLELKPISNEQQYIVDTLKNFNVSCQATAGSGKTTTIFHIAKHFKTSNILTITYNSKLSKEMAQKIINYNVQNLSVFTVHAFINRYYCSCRNDDELLDFLENPQIKPQQNQIMDQDDVIFLNNICYDIVIIDEIQDFNSILYKAITRILNDNSNGRATKICTFGDTNQCIYTQLNGSSSCYLLESKKWFGQFSKYPWKECHLTQSFRLTYETAGFINECMKIDIKIKTNKFGKKPLYIYSCHLVKSKCRKACGTPYHIDDIIDACLKQYRPEDIFILAPAIRNPYHIRLIANYLTKKGINIYVGITEDSMNSINLLKNKLVITTYYQSKGLERSCVIVLSFSSDYNKYYKKDDTSAFSPELFVACTRAIDQLVLVHFSGYNTIKYVDQTKLKNYVIQMPPIIILQKLKNGCNNKNNLISVTDIIRYKNHTFLRDIYKQLEIIQIRTAQQNIIQIENEIEQPNGNWEFVSDINGKICEYLFEFWYLYKNNPSKTEFNNMIKKAIKDVSNKFAYRERQLIKRNWFTNECIESLKKVYAIFKDIVGRNGLFQKIYSMKWPKYKVEICGTIDYIDDENIIELKFIDGPFKKEHAIQAMMYAFINANYETKKKIYLFNMKTSECKMIKFDLQLFDKLANELIDKHFTSHQ